MGVALSIIFMVLGVALISLCQTRIMLDNPRTNRWWFVVMPLGYVVLFSAILWNLQQNPSTPKALDVYRGSTELKVKKTYRSDTILIGCDSTVIFKERR